MDTIKNFLWVGLGGSIGAMLRFLISSVWKTENFPFSTLLINIAGSFFIGMIFAASLKDGVISEQFKLFLATGICGGFTTFSAFSLENMQLIRSGNFLIAGLYIALSILVGIAAVFLGFKLVNH